MITLQAYALGGVPAAGDGGLSKPSYARATCMRYSVNSPKNDYTIICEMRYNRS